MSFSALPSDCVVAVCRYLGPESTCSLAATSRLFERIANSDATWIDKLRTYHGMSWEEDWGEGQDYPALPPSKHRKPNHWKHIFIRMSLFVSEFRLKYAYFSCLRSQRPTDFTHRPPVNPPQDYKPNIYKLMIIGDSCAIPSCWFRLG